MLNICDSKLPSTPSSPLCRALEICKRKFKKFQITSRSIKLRGWWGSRSLWRCLKLRSSLFGPLKTRIIRSFLMSLGLFKILWRYMIIRSFKTFMPKYAISLYICLFLFSIIKMVQLFYSFSNKSIIKIY